MNVDKVMKGAGAACAVLLDRQQPLLGKVGSGVCYARQVFVVSSPS
jgi:hypothetical protein